MSYRAHYRSLAVATVFTLVVALALFMPNVSANDGGDIQVEKPQLTYPNLSTHLNHLAEGYNSGQMSQGQAAGEARSTPAAPSPSPSTWTATSPTW